ncbi:hypothetical protein PybrP1_006381 [[Pythium] brassicae (nom. inval.)]|nr:hypothetical protein PybrP1_006381 [[Pythium] brassicae (nom. inval.)]
MATRASVSPSPPPPTTTAPAAAFAKLPPLDTGAAPLQRLRDQHERALLELLGSLDAGDLTLVLSSRVAALLTHVLVRGLDALRSVQVVQCLELADDAAHTPSCRSVVYLSLARVSEVRAVAQHASTLLQGPAPRELFLFVGGCWTSLCDEVLAHHQLTERVRTGSVPLGFVPLDSDVLTLGHERCLYDCGIAGDRSALVDVAMALNQLQELYGRFEHIKYKGELAMLVLNHMMELSQSPGGRGDDAPQEPKPRKRSVMNTLILLDRRVDYASALSTPLTYEALLDEILHIQDGFISLSPMLLTSDPNASDAPIAFALNSADAVFEHIRSLNVHAIPPALNAQASALKTSFRHFQSTSAAASAAEVHEFVKGVPQMKASQQHLEHHINLLEYLELTTNSRAFRDQWTLERAIMDLADDALDAVQEMMFRHEPLSKVLRLLCLYSVVHSGLPRRDLERMKLHLVRTYGHELVFSFENLERLGLFYEQRESSRRSSPDKGANTTFSSGSGTAASRPSFQFIADELQAIDLDVNIDNPKTAAFVTSGYAPISVRLVEEILKSQSWRAVDAAMNCLHGPRAEISVVPPPERETTARDVKSSKKRRRKRVVVVCFVGGVTHLEVAALRWLSQFYPHELLIASTSLTNGTTLLNGVLEHLPSTA